MKNRRFGTKSVWHTVSPTFNSLKMAWVVRIGAAEARPAAAEAPVTAAAAEAGAAAAEAVAEAAAGARPTAPLARSVVAPGAEPEDDIPNP